MPKKSDPKVKTDQVDIYVPKQIKISIGVEAAKHEITSSELIRDILNARLDTSAPTIQLPAIEGEELIRMRTRIGRDSNKKIECLSATFDTSKHQIMRATIINFLKEAGAIQ
ncbi:MAG: hypothetical protein PHN69_08480 [Candidatus Pacebacteria bacterium]|nr:hypothetical protein [Candidatus Paceibacterota bacterium]